MALLANWRLILAGSLLAALLLLYALWRHEHARADKAEARTEAAERVSDLRASVLQSLNTYHAKTVIIRERADHAVKAIEQAPGADEPVPPAVRDVWLSGLASLRDEPASVPDRAPGKPKS